MTVKAIKGGTRGRGKNTTTTSEKSDEFLFVYIYNKIRKLREKRTFLNTFEITASRDASKWPTESRFRPVTGASRGRAFIGCQESREPMGVRVGFAV